jgi:RNA polymerase sigma factor (sigma-70 family)
MGPERIALVVAARAGGREAFARLVGCFQDLAVATAYARLRDPQLAEDAAQEAFADAFLHVAQLREPAAFPGWLRRVVLKHCDRIVRRKRLPLTSLDAVEVPSGVAATEGALVEREERARLRAAVEALPEAERLLVALHYLGGFEESAMAEYLELPLSTVKKRLHTARRRLRKEIDAMLERDLARLRPSQTRRFSDTVELFLAVRSGDRDALRAILDRSPELVNAEEGWELDEAALHDLPVPTRATPLIRAAERGDLALVDLLLARGAEADRGCGCAGGEGALWAALAAGRTRVASRLLAAGADPNRAAFADHTALHVAAMRGHDDLVESLLAHGADPRRRSREGATPLDWARAKGHARAAALLERAGGTQAVECRVPATAAAGRPEARGILATGIKALDLFAPLAQGSIVRVEAGAQVGRNVLLAELSSQLVRSGRAEAIWAVWERQPWQDEEVAGLFAEGGLGGEIQLLRARADGGELERRGLPARALALAEERLAAGAGSVLLVLFESDGCAADVEAIYPKLGGAVTTLVVADWRRVADAPMEEPRSLAIPFDARIRFDPALAARRCYPALDPFACASRAPWADIVGEEHARLAESARACLRRERELAPDLAPLAPGGLGAEDRTALGRSVRLRAFLTQPFHTTEPFSGRAGVGVPLVDTLAGVRAILAGEADALEPSELLYRGALPTILAA